MTYIPVIESITKMTPVQFEKYTLTLLSSLCNNLDNCTITHDEKIKSYDGEYQIDISIRFNILGVNYHTLVECKMHNSSIKRELVQVLHDKIQVLGAQKGILISTASFQSGAISYAKAHGIALIQIIDGELCYETRSGSNISIKPPSWINIPQYNSVLIQESDSASILCSYGDGCIEGLKKFLLS